MQPAVVTAAQSLWSVNPQGNSVTYCHASFSVLAKWG